MRDDNGKVAVWFLTGAAIGAAVALLYAPSTGKDMRKRLARSAGDGGEVLSVKGREMIDRGRELYDKGRAMADEAADLFERGRKMVEG